MKIPRCMKSNIAANKRRILRANQGQVPHCNKEIVSFVVLLTCGVLVLLLVKRVVIAREKTILLACAERNWKILVGKQCMPWLKSQTTATLELICLHFQWNEAANGPVSMTGTSCLRSLVLT